MESSGSSKFVVSLPRSTSPRTADTEARFSGWMKFSTRFLPSVSFGYGQMGSTLMGPLHKE